MLTPSYRPLSLSPPDSETILSVFRHGAGNELDTLLTVVSRILQRSGAGILLFRKEAFTDVHVSKRILCLAALRLGDRDSTFNLDVVVHVLNQS